MHKVIEHAEKSKDPSIKRVPCFSASKRVRVERSVAILTQKQCNHLPRAIIRLKKIQYEKHLCRDIKHPSIVHELKVVKIGARTSAYSPLLSPAIIQPSPRPRMQCQVVARRTKARSKTQAHTALSPHL